MTTPDLRTERALSSPRKSGLIVSRIKSERVIARNGRVSTAVLPKPALSKPAQVRRLDSAQASQAEAPTLKLDRSRWQRRYATKLRIADIAVVSGAVIFAQYLRFGDAPLAPAPVTHYATVYSGLIAILWLSTLAGFHTRSARILGRGIEEYRRAVEASLWTFGAISMAELLFKLDIARGYLAMALPVGILGLVLSRWLARQYVVCKRVDGKYQTAVLAVGQSEAVASFANELTRNPMDGYRIAGACILGSDPASDEHLFFRDGAIPIVGGETGDLVAMIRKCGADTVAIVGTGHFGEQEIRKLIWKLEPMGVDLVVSPGVTDVALFRLTMLPVAGLPLLHIEKPQYRGTERIRKRSFDICFAMVALVLALPILLVAAIAIKADSKGPVFYSSERIGLGGKPFCMLKLRTMVVDADKKLDSLLASNECDGHLFKIRNDPRITPVGRILRRFSIDELPQFINVLRRQMSVVGPRPLFRLGAEECEYDSTSQRRLLVKPGITGLWQISGRSNLSWNDGLSLDLSYVDNWSMSSDIAIIAKTMRSVLQREGAY
jgi:exopolysaccharide biosynthesis polyprenyl glycosylphosphotransferase